MFSRTSYAARPTRRSLQNLEAATVATAPKGFHALPYITAVAVGLVAYSASEIFLQQGLGPVQQQLENLHMKLDHMEDSMAEMSKEIKIIQAEVCRLHATTDEKRATCSRVQARLQALLEPEVK
ncbi:hypothetical protein WJX73_000353 [Symbiochloris irregularis]|uniref:Uncharacterized protein n=1 Tax=Symbiochloris irregularis TaxID=706552 RepID=A0AAW1Q3B2_9CHLO